MTIKNLMIKMNQVCKKNLGKVIYALFLLTIIESLVTALFLFPAIKIFSEAQENLALGEIQTRVIFFVLVFAALVVWLTFQFGFAIMLLRMVRNEPTNLGFLFMGFRRFNPAGKVIFSFSAIFAVIGIVTRFITKFIFSRIWPSISSTFDTVSSELEQATESSATAANGIAIAADSVSSALPFSLGEATSVLFESGLFAGIFFVLSFVVVIHFAFVFHLHFDNPSLKTSGLFSKSFKMMKGNVFRLIGFALRAGGKNLLIALVFALIVTFLPKGKSGLFLFDLIYFINLYTALVKFYFAVPVMYEQIRTKGDELRIENSEQANTDSTQINTDKKD